MTAPHPAYMTPEAFEIAAVFGLRTIGDVASEIKAQDEADKRAAACRELCLKLKMRQELMVALIARAASEYVVRAAAQRFRDWSCSIGCADYFYAKRGITPPEPPSREDAAAAIVDECIRLERDGLLERVVGGSK